MKERIASEEKYIKISDFSEHFSYVIMSDSLRYKEDGMKSLRMNDYMKFADIVKKLNMKIDINYYLGKMVGMCARFINKDNRYQPSSLYKIMQLKDSDKKKKQINNHF